MRPVTDQTLGVSCFILAHFNACSEFSKTENVWVLTEKSGKLFIGGFHFGKLNSKSFYKCHHKGNG